MANSNALAGAGLAICEALILSLIDNGVLTTSEGDGLLQDAMNAHLNVAKDSEDAQVHQEAAEIINNMRKGKDGVRAASKKP